MSRNVEVESATERDVEKLHAFADGEDRQLPFERIFGGSELPAVALRLHVRIENRRIGDGLMKKLRRDIRTAAQEQALHFLERHVLCPGVPEPHVRMFSESATKPFVILLANPSGHVRRPDFATLHPRCK